MARPIGLRRPSAPWRLSNACPVIQILPASELTRFAAMTHSCQRHPDSCCRNAVCWRNDHVSELRFVGQFVDGQRHLPITLNDIDGLPTIFNGDTIRRVVKPGSWLSRSIESSLHRPYRQLFVGWLSPSLRRWQLRSASALPQLALGCPNESSRGL